MIRIRFLVALTLLASFAACEQTATPSLPIARASPPVAQSPAVEPPQPVAPARIDKPLTTVPQPAPAKLPPIEIHFSPRGGCTDAVVKEIDAAKASILVQAYSFTSARIAKALVDAHKRGVKVQMILDKSNRTQNYSAADFVLHAGIPTLIDAKHAIAHNKIMILDGEVVITGSFNFTKAAEESNAENLLVIRDKAIAEQYTANWNEHSQHSDKYEGKDGGDSESVSPVKPTPLVAPDDADGGYVASKNSSVFHKADCKEVHRIKDKNLIYFKTREEAIASGRHPCAVCNP